MFLRSLEVVTMKHTFPEYEALNRLKRGVSHTPHIKAKQIKGLSIPCVVVDYKTGRSVELLSQGEKYIWYLLRFDDEIEDIYEQYPLDLEITLELSRKYGILHPKNTFTPMTTDFFVKKKDGYAAYSVKNDRSVLDKRRNVEKLFLEKMYWDQLGIEFHLVFKEGLNMTLVNNIMDVVTCYDPKNIFDQFDKIRYKIAHKMIDIDLESKPINYRQIMEKEYE